MSSGNDNFIDEVFDDLRRERLFRLFRRWGWVAGMAIMVIVAGVVWREWNQAHTETRSQVWGDAILAAEASGDPAAIAAVDPAGAESRRVLSALLAASAWADKGDTAAAAAALADVAGDTAADTVLHDLAELKLAMAGGNGMDAAQRDEILARLAKPGAPFELLALEQQAIALMGAGRTGDAVALIRQIQQKPGLSVGLRGRLSDMMIALGAEPEAVPATTPATPAEVPAAE